jgi:hypothetical protein
MITEQNYWQYLRAFNQSAPPDFDLRRGSGRYGNPSVTRRSATWSSDNHTE